MRAFDRVGAAVSAFCLAALFLFPFVSERGNRLAPAAGIPLFEALGAWEAGALVLLLFLLAFRLPGFLGERRDALSRAFLSVGLAFLGLLFAGNAAGRLTAFSPLARVSLSSGAWFLVVGAFVLYRTSCRKLPQGSLERLFAALLPFVILLPFLHGKLDSLSLVVEYLNRSGRFGPELRRHLALGLSAVASGTFAGVPLGYAATRNPALKGPIFAVTGTLQTFPSLALFGLLVAPLAWASRRFAFLKALGIAGIGWAPAYVALSLYSLLPIVQNTHAGFASLSPDMLDAADGMGMSRLQRLLRIEVPVAGPIILGGVRVASVQAVGNTAVAALIGAGGLGTFIFQGLGEAAPDLILLGSLPILLMAVLMDGILGWLIRLMTPRGMREVPG